TSPAPCAGSGPHCQLSDRHGRPRIKSGAGSLPARGARWRKWRCLVPVIPAGRPTPDGGSRLIDQGRSPSQGHDMLKTAIPVIHVSDTAVAEDFYCKGLGFKLVSSWRPDETRHDPCYMVLVRDDAHLHVTSFKDGVVGTWTSTVYVFVDDVDALRAEL